MFVKIFKSKEESNKSKWRKSKEDDDNNNNNYDDEQKFLMHLEIKICVHH